MTVHDLGWRDRTQKKKFIFNPSLWSSIPALFVMIYIFWIPKKDMSTRSRSRESPADVREHPINTASVETNASARGLAISGKHPSCDNKRADIPSISNFSTSAENDIHASSPESVQKPIPTSSPESGQKPIPTFSNELQRSNTFAHLSVMKSKAPPLFSSQKNISQLPQTRTNIHKQSTNNVELTSFGHGELPHILENTHVFPPQFPHDLLVSRSVPSPSTCSIPGLLKAPPALVISPQTSTQSLSVSSQSFGLNVTHDSLISRWHSTHEPYVDHVHDLYHNPIGTGSDACIPALNSVESRAGTFLSEPSESVVHRPMYV